MNVPACNFKRAMYLIAILTTTAQFTGQTTQRQPNSQPRIPPVTPTVVISFGPAQAVLAPSGVASPCAAQSSCVNPSSINCWGGLGSLADEHSSILPPKTIGIPNTPNHTLNTEYLFFVAAKTCNNGANTTKNGFDTSGLVVLQSLGPDKKGTWALDYADGYGQLPGTTYPNSQIFLSPMNRTTCPNVPPAQQDPTFDLNYANAGSIVLDPTNPGPDSLLMVFEGTNRCAVGSKGGAQKTQASFYSTIGVATSQNWGSIWPAYKNNFTPLPTQSTTNGPNAPHGASGAQVCPGNNCSTASPSRFGRTAALSAPMELAEMIKGNIAVQHSMGDSSPSAFVDDVNTSSGIFLYTAENYGTKPYSYPGTQSGTIGVSRAPLGQGFPLKFTKWYGPTVGYDNPSSGSFLLQTSTVTATGAACDPRVPPPCLSNSGLASDNGGLESPIFPLATQEDSAQYLYLYQSCQAFDQNQSGPSISYLDVERLYLLTFVCMTPKTAKQVNAGATPGTAIFYSTNPNLENQAGWTTPQQIYGSWSPLESNGKGTNCVYDGWYPTFMSLDATVGHLSNSGYVFSMKGCMGSSAGEPRQYTSRTFTIGTKPNPIGPPQSGP